MTVVKLSFWFMWRSFINGIKRTWKVTAVIIGIVTFMIGIGIVVDIVTSDGDEQSTSQEEMQEEADESEDGMFQDDDINEKFDIVIDDESNKVYVYCERIKNDATIFLPELVCGVICTIVMALAVWQGAKKGADIFTMPDVNFLFPAPLKPQSVLLFKIIGQIGGTFMGLIYFSYQIPNLINSFELGVASIILLMISFVILMITSKHINILTYCVLSKAPRLKRIVAKYGFCVGFIPVIIVAFFNRILNWNLYDSVYNVFSNIPSKLIPFWGWIKAAGAYAFAGDIKKVVLYLLVTVVGLAALVWITWKMNVDFYEDALGYATSKQIAMDVAVQQGGSVQPGVKHEGKHESKKWNRIRNKELSFEKYEGAKVLFCKTILNRKRFYPLNGLWSNSCNLYFFLCLGCTLTVKYLFDGNSLYVIVALMILTMFLRSFTSPMAQETEHIFIYMMPESPYKIVGWGMAGQVLECALDFAPAFMLLYILSDFSSVIILWYLVMVSLNLFFGMIALLVDIVISFYVPVLIVNVLQIFLRIIPVIPLLIAAAVGIITSNAAIALVLIILINITFSSIFYVMCSMFLFKGKR